jgi:hypothetical protein
MSMPLEDQGRAMKALKLTTANIVSLLQGLHTNRQAPGVYGTARLGLLSRFYTFFKAMSFKRLSICTVVSANSLSRFGWRPYCPDHIGVSVCQEIPASPCVCEPHLQLTCVLGQGFTAAAHMPNYKAMQGRTQVPLDGV